MDDLLPPPNPVRKWGRCFECSIDEVVEQCLSCEEWVCEGYGILDEEGTWFCEGCYQP